MDILEIIKRVKISCGYSSDAELARALNMSPQNFLSQKKTGKIKDSLMVHAIERGGNIDWIKTGQGSMTAGHGVGAHIGESQAPYSGAAFANHTPTQSKPLLELTADVLSTDSVYRSALESNVKAFHDAVSARKQLAVAEAKLAQCQRDNIELKQELNERDLLIEKLQAVVSELRAIQEMLGHAQISTTMFYTHVVTEDIRVATEDMFREMMNKRRKTASKC